MSDEDEVNNDQQSEEEETTEKEVTQIKLPSKVEQNSHASKSQQHRITVKMSSNTAH